MAEVLRRGGGVLDARVLVAFTSRRAVARAVERGEVLRVARGRYALPAAEDALRAGHALSAVVSGRSAAAHHGWAVKVLPELPELTVPRRRKVPAERRHGVRLRWRDVPASDQRHGVLLPGPTVIDCARTLPFDEALAIADSALRSRAVTGDEVLALADRVATTGRARALAVARAADGRAANPFESVLRAIALGVRGLDLEPQRVIRESGFVGRPDLVDPERRIVVEAESFEFHGQRGALVRDCRRYTALVVRGWRVVRFSWEDVMLHPEQVRLALVELAALPVPRRTHGQAARARPARDVA